MPNSIELFEEKSRRAASSDELHQFVSFIGPPPRYAAIRTKLIYSRLAPEDLAQEWQRRDPDISLVNEATSTYQITDSRWNSSDYPSIKRRSGFIAMLPGSGEGILRLTSICYSAFWNVSVRRSVRRGYPSLMPVFFQQREFKEALLRFENSLASEYQLIITDVGMKEPRIGHPKSARITKFDSERLWTRAQLSDLFAQAEERGQWFTSVGFTLFRAQKARDSLIRAASGKLYKSGEVLISYLYSEVAEILLPHLEKLASQRIRLLSNRGLRERNLDPAKPIQIGYSSDVFGSQARLHEFAGVVAKYPNSTKAVFHSNPYYHASIADYKDGSSIDIWVLNPRRILLVPQAKSSPAAFGRLISHIFDEFQEGDVTEFEDTD